MIFIYFSEAWRRRRAGLLRNREKYQEIRDQTDPELKAELETGQKTEFENDPDDEMETELENDPKAEVETEYQNDPEVEMSSEFKNDPKIGHPGY